MVAAALIITYVYCTVFDDYCIIEICRKTNYILLISALFVPEALNIVVVQRYQDQEHFIQMARSNQIIKRKTTKTKGIKIIVNR